ncbi:hypothetical protein G6F43_001130 [Rhizopus delemar]|nr:hypothetical protein G6F43_001130 [Rhizopus delemar]
MRSVLVIFGLLSAFMLVSSLPLDPATLEKRQLGGCSVLDDPSALAVPIDLLDPSRNNDKSSLVTGLAIKLFLHSAAANQASLLVQNAKNLSDIPDKSIDAYTIAFGIRTCTHFSKVNNPLIGKVCDIHSFNIISVLGQIIDGNHDSYQYLVESIRKFSPQEKIAQIIRDAGFKTVGKDYKNFTFGVVAIHSGHKI